MEPFLILETPKSFEVAAVESSTTAIIEAAA
jgi:hypothetical protein